MNDGLPSEVALAAACCRWPVDAHARERVRSTAERIANWERFAGIVKRNQVGPLAHRALTGALVNIPEAIAEPLAQRARNAAGRGLQQARESLGLQRAFEAAGLPLMILKGSPLAILAYGDLGIKESCDIDLLVSRGDAEAGRELLSDLGYESIVDKLDSRGFEIFLQQGKEVTFHHPRKGITVDLHWRLIDHRGPLRGVTVHGPAQTVALSGGTLRTLDDGPLFAHLCVHGAAHNWSRLKWLADVAAFAGKRSASEVEGLYAAACSYGAGRSASVTLALCQRLFDLPLSKELCASLAKDSIVRALEASALAGLVYRGGAVEHGAYTTAWIRTKAAQLLLAPGAAHVADQVRLMWEAPKDRVRVPLPRRLAFLYHLIRVPLWLGRIGGRAVERRRVRGPEPRSSGHNRAAEGPPPL